MPATISSSYSAAGLNRLEGAVADLPPRLAEPVDPVRVISQLPLPWTAGAVSVILTVGFYLVSLSARAGALEQQVRDLRSRQDVMDTRRDAVASELAVIDEKLGRLQGSLESVRGDVLMAGSGRK